MHSDLYDLQIDYIQQQGHYMTINRTPGLQIHDLVQHQVKMMQYNVIPRLLPIEIEEMDGNVQLRYNITGKRMLSQVIRTEKMTLIEYYSLLIQIVTALCDSNIYMLDEHRYVLHEDYIFIGRDYTDVYLVFLPIQLMTTKGTYQAELKDLAYGWMGAITELKGDGIQQLMIVLREDNFTAQELKRKLLEIIKEKGRGAEERRPPGNDMERIQAIDDNSNIEPFKWIEEDEHPSQGDGFKTGKTFIAIVLIIANALVWRSYFTQPLEGMLYVCLGVSLLSLNAVYVLLRIWQPRFLKGISDQHLDPYPDSSHPSRDQTNISISDPMEDEYYNELQHKTTLLTAPDATVFLSAHQEREHSSPSCPVLEIHQDDELKQIPIIGESFIIGREHAAEVDYVENDIGVSRAHCEIMSSDAQYGLKDLGSKNGSYLNEALLVPYKVYPLKDGDRIKIIRTEMIFKIGN